MPVPEGLFILSLDISARKQIEEGLRESEEKFRLTFDSSPDAININRLRDGLYVDISEGFTQLTGYTRGEVTGKTSAQIAIWHDPADRQKLVQGLLSQGFYNNLEARFRKKDGSLTTALMSARLIPLNGEPHIISITRDISERKHAEAEREKLLMAIEQAHEIVAITDKAGAMQYVNPAFEAITGYLPAEAIGQNPRLLKSGQHDVDFYRGLWDTILSGFPWAGRIVNKRKDGSLYSAECSISPIKTAQGEVSNFVWISRDITKEMELEKRVSQAQKMEAIGALAGGIAHDFNNLLFPITGMAEMLIEDLEPGSANHENAAEILVAAKRASDLVNQILAFSRLSEPQRSPVSLQLVLKEVLKLARQHRNRSRPAKRLRLGAGRSDPSASNRAQLDHQCPACRGTFRREDFRPVGASGVASRNRR
jgi:PAS domain S-box-containing protein